MADDNEWKKGRRFGLPEGFSSTLTSSLEEPSSPGSPKRKLGEPTFNSGFSFLASERKSAGAMPIPAEQPAAVPYGKKPTFGGSAPFVGKLKEQALPMGQEPVVPKAFSTRRSPKAAARSSMYTAETFQHAVNHFDEQVVKPRSRPESSFEAFGAFPAAPNPNIAAAAQAFDRQQVNPAASGPPTGTSGSPRAWTFKPGPYQPPNLAKSPSRASQKSAKAADPAFARRASPESARQNGGGGSAAGQSSEGVGFRGFHGQERSPQAWWSKNTQAADRAAGSNKESFRFGRAAAPGMQDGNRGSSDWSEPVATPPSINTFRTDPSDVSCSSQGSPMECSPYGINVNPFSAFRPGRREASVKKHPAGASRLHSAKAEPAAARSKKKSLAAQKPIQTPSAIPGLAEEEEGEMDGIAVDFARVKPFETPTKTAAQPTFEGVFAEKVGLTPSQQQRASEGFTGRPEFVFGTGPEPNGFASKAQAPISVSERSGSGASSKTPGPKAKPTKQKPSPKKAKPVRQQPVRMNGQPLNAGTQKPPAPSAAELPSDSAAGGKWTAFAADLKATRTSGEEPAAPQAEGMKTPATKLWTDSPGPVPMSGLAYPGAAKTATIGTSPNPQDLPQPADTFFSRSSQEGYDDQDSTDRGPEVMSSARPTSESSRAAAKAEPLVQPQRQTRGAEQPVSVHFPAASSSNPFSGWTAGAQKHDQQFQPADSATILRGRREVEQNTSGSSAGFSASLEMLQQKSAVPVAAGHPAMGVTQPLKMTAGLKTATERESRALKEKGRRKAVHPKPAVIKEGQRGFNAQNQDPNLPMQAPPAALPGAAAVSAEPDLLAVREAASKMRMEANDLHSKADYSNAVRLYKEAIKQLAAVGMIEDTGILYSNLAATSLVTRRPAAALHYCEKALKADPGLLKAEIRAGVACWQLGNFQAAANWFDKACDRSDAPPTATEQREQFGHFQKRMQKAFEAFQAAKSSDDIQKLLVEIQILLQIAHASQEILSLHAHALLRANRLAEATQLAERHTWPAESNQAVPTWPWWVKAQSAFLQGDLSRAAEIIEEELQRAASGQEGSLAVDGGFQLQREELTAAASGMRELLQLKEAGNRAQKLKDHDTAIQQYTAALAAHASASPPFAAVLHANRAAAHHAKSSYADAIADTLRAKALDRTYAKAQSRLAALLMDCRLFGAAVSVLEELAELLPASDPNRREVMQRLLAAKANAAKKLTPDHYRLLGLKRSCRPDEVRKVYKKLALKLHPDKAMSQCKFTASICPSAQKLVCEPELEATVRDKANWLFQLVGEANAALSNASTRLKLDSDLAFEERRASGRQASSHRGFNARAYARDYYSFRPWNEYEFDSEDPCDNDDGGFAEFTRRYANFNRW